jgi:hypothetical protein
MTDTRLPDRWLTDRRIQRLTDRAYRAFFNALMWSVANRTDGIIEPEDLALIPGFTPCVEDELVAAGVWIERNEGWLIADFGGTQTTRAEHQLLEHMRTKAREKKARQRAVAAGVGTVPGDGPIGTVPGDRNRDQTGQDRTGEVRSTSSVTNQGNQESLRNLGTELARPRDHMNRPSMSITAQVSGASERAPEPPPRDHHVSQRARDLVKAGLTDRLWRVREVRAGLELHVDRALDNGTDVADIAKTLSAWKGKKAAGEEIYPGHFPHLLSGVIAEQDATPQDIRNGRPMATSDRNFLASQALKRQSPTRKELT